MFQFQSPMRRGPLAGALRTAAVALVGAFSMATAGHASTYLMANGSMDSPRVVNIAGVGNVYAAPMLFDGTKDGDAFTDLVSWCVDVYHEISLSNYSPNLSYTDTVPLTTDSAPSPTVLTVAQLTQIGRLVNYGNNVFYDAPHDAARLDELAVVQSAIWQVVSGKNVTWSGHDARIDGLSGAGYLALFQPAFATLNAHFKLLTPTSPAYPDPRGPQSFAISAAPEPGGWALMILGFGGAGVLLRRRRAQAAA